MSGAATIEILTRDSTEMIGPVVTLLAQRDANLAQVGASAQEAVVAAVDHFTIYRLLAEERAAALKKRPKLSRRWPTRLMFP